MSDNELLLAMSEMMDKKLSAALEPIRGDIRRIRIDLENTVKPQLNLLIENYIPAAQKYEDAASKITEMQEDIDLLKKVVQEHSEKLNKIA